MQTEETLALFRLYLDLRLNVSLMDLQLLPSEPGRVFFIDPKSFFFLRFISGFEGELLIISSKETGAIWLKNQKPKTVPRRLAWAPNEP